MKFRYITFILLFWGTALFAACPEMQSGVSPALQKILDVSNFITTNPEYETCRATQDLIPPSEWTEIKNSLWNNVLFRNMNPDGICDKRANLISKLLDEKGFKSEQLYIYGTTMASFETPNGFQSVWFSSHTAIVITMLNDKNILTKYVVDPTFTDDIVPLDKYISDMKVVTEPKEELRYRVVGQGQQYWDKRDLLLNEELQPSNECKYSSEVLAENKQTILETIQKSPNPFTINPPDGRKRLGFSTREQAREYYLKYYSFK